MLGTILQVNISIGGVPKRPIAQGFVSPLGLEGDAHAHPEIHGGPRQAVLLICAEAIDELAAKGYPVFPGALGENLTTRGIDRRELRAGQRFRVGQAVIELTKVRGPCTTLDVYGPSIKAEIYDREVNAGNTASPKWAMSGFYAAVVETGVVRRDDIIALIDHVV
jgi:MOSC domain-containing protein YiiM